ncbi:kinase-like domain-containing protein [Xylaria cubensis]|nr:kinase-like domain-containing protein [Xylaria cubensis]
MPTTHHCSTVMDTLKSVASAIAKKLPSTVRKENGPNEIIDLQNIPRVREARLLATGGYNSVWLVKLHQPLQVSQSVSESSATPTSQTTNNHNPPISQFVLRLPGEDSLLPQQVTNDVAFKQFVANRLPHIPVPQVYLYQATNHADTSFIVEEYIDCLPISSTWMSLSPSEKENLAQLLANIMVDLAEVQFDMIGGLDPTDWSPAPTVEGCKLFKGRGKFHRNECYPIGPYKSTKEYILSCYDREIYYYTHATSEDIDEEFFVDISVQDFVEELREKRKALSEIDIVDEPFVLVHGDFLGRNILARGDQITAVLDWDFAGFYPLSETLSYGDVDVVEMESEELFNENMTWGRKIRAFVQNEIVKRSWDQSRIDLLMGDGNSELGAARMEMFPEQGATCDSD